MTQQRVKCGIVAVACLLGACQRGASSSVESQRNTATRPVEEARSEAETPAGKTETPAPVAASTDVTQPAEPAQQLASPMLKALAQAVGGSPYCAVVKHSRVEVQRVGKGEERQIRHAQVLETIRGPKLKQLVYTISTEPGESTRLPKGPVILTLCRDAEGFYWPGVGSSFPAEAETRATAKQAAASAPADQTLFKNCE